MLIVIMRDLICGLASKVDMNAAYLLDMHEAGLKNASERFRVCVFHVLLFTNETSLKML